LEMLYIDLPIFHNPVIHKLIKLYFSNLKLCFSNLNIYFHERYESYTIEIWLIWKGI
jgi:hypothetical protein